MATRTADADEPDVAGQVIDQSVEAAESGGFQTFRSLRYRNYRLLWAGTLFSSSGQWIQQVTLSWLVYDMTGSGLLLGTVNGMRALPLLIFGPFGGVAADRFDKKRLMFTTQMFQMVSAAVLAVVIVSGAVEVWHLFAFSALTGVGWAFNMPVRQSIVPNVVPRRDLMNAMALNSAGFNATRIVGPALAGLMIAKIGPGENFFVQSAAYLGVAAMVLQLRLPDIPRTGLGSVRGSLSEGARYVWGNRTLRMQMILALAPVLLAMPFISLLPILAVDTLGKSAGGYGVMMAAPGLGAVIATLFIASVPNVRRKGLLLLGAVLMLGVSLVLLGLSRSYPLTVALLVLVGAAQMTYMTTNQTIVQLGTPDEYRGRVMGIYMLNQGLLPAGSVFAGAAADLVGAPWTITFMGGTVAVLAALFLLRSPSLRRIAL